MHKLTTKEKEIMEMLWKHGAMFIKDLLPLYKEPKPHYNTVATLIKILEEKGFVTHRAFGNIYQYEAIVSENDYKTSAINDVVSELYNNSFTSVVSQFIENESMDIEELKELIRRIESAKK